MIHSALSNWDVLNEKSKTEEIVAEVFASYHCISAVGGVEKKRQVFVTDVTIRTNENVENIL